jgi:hypothetical protein
VLAVGICLTAAFVFKKSKNAAEIPAKMLWACIEEKTNMHEAAQARKEVAPPNTRAFDNLKTDADRKHDRLQACRRHLHGGTLVFRGRLHRVLVIGIAHVKPGGRALVSARCKGGSYDAECSANYTADVYTLLCANHRSLRKK